MKVNISEEEYQKIRQGKCPDCGRKLTRGPQVNCSVNLLCYGCGSRFNVSAMELGETYGVYTPEAWAKAAEYWKKGYIRERLEEKVAKQFLIASPAPKKS